MLMTTFVKFTQEEQKSILEKSKNNFLYLQKTGSVSKAIKGLYVMLPKGLGDCLKSNGRMYKRFKRNPIDLILSLHPFLRQGL